MLFRSSTLNIDLGAGKFEISDTSSNLVDVEAAGLIEGYELKSDDGVNINLSMIGPKHLKIDGNNKIKRKAYIKLNQNVTWNLNFQIGAASIDSDLRNFKIRNINLDGGASKIDFDLGNLCDTMEVNINTGASSVEINIPRSSGCEIYTNTGLSGEKFSDFIKYENNIYRTDNYDNSTKKIFIKINGGISSFKVRRI